MGTDRLNTSPEVESSHIPGWVHDLILDRKEHTLGGCAIGIVRDLTGSETDSGRTVRAQSNDEMAQVAADTIAFLPSMKWTTGGALRAALLIDPHRSLSGNLGSAGLNFVEGAALNKVGRLGGPESMLGKAISGRLGEGLLAETVTHASVGLGMGVVRTGFSADSWKDGSGRFSLAAGAENLVKNGTVGAAINVPAGMLGLRVSRAASVSLSGRSAELASLVSNAGSGYASGTVFGGIDALMAHKGWGDVLSDMNRGGIVGGITGGFAHFGGDRSASLPQSKPAEELLLRSSQTSAAPEHAANAKRDVLAVFEKPALSEQIHYPFSDTQIEPELQSLRALGERLETPKQAKMRITVPRKGESLEGPFKDYRDFLSRFKEIQEDVRVYPVKGHTTRIVVPEEYARQLDEVRQLRLVADRDINLAGTEEAAKEITQADERLKQHPYGWRALPEDFVPFLDALPDRRYVKQLTILDRPDHEDPYYRQTMLARYHELVAEKGPEHVSPSLKTTAETFMAAATATSDGQITFYRPEDAFGLGENVFHEWAHQVKFQRADDSDMFDKAAQIEKKGFFAREYAKLSDHEDYAVHFGENLINFDADIFETTAMSAPIRTAVMGKTLKSLLSEVPEAARSPYHQTYLQRVEAIEQMVAPVARESLLDQVASGGRENKRLALELIDELGMKPDLSNLDSLKDMAFGAKDASAAKRAFEHAFSLTDQDPEGRFQLLVQLGQPNSSARDQALEAMWRMRDYRAPAYRRYLQALGDEPNPLEMQKIAKQMPDPEGQRMAYREAVHMARIKNDLQMVLEVTHNAPDFNTKHYAFGQAMSMAGKNQDAALGTALHTLLYEPALRPQALDFLGLMADSRTLNSVSKFVRDSDPVVAAKARAVQQRINQSLDLQAKESQFIQLGNALRMGTVESRLEAVDKLVDLKDPRSIRPLLEAALSATPTVSQRAATGLSHYGSNLVRYEARELTRQNPELRGKVQEVLTKAAQAAS